MRCFDSGRDILARRRSTFRRFVGPHHARDGAPHRARGAAVEPHTSFSRKHQRLAAVLTIGIVAAVAVLIALPTFFEIPLALLLLQVGAPEGAALALLFAGPIVNLPSLLVLANDGETRRVSGALALGIFALAFGGGLLLAFV